MSDFNNMTVVAAAQIIEAMHSQAQFNSLATEWNLIDQCGAGSVLSKVNVVAQIAIQGDVKVYTIEGIVPLDRAMIELALRASPKLRKLPEWTKLLAGLRFDGFEVCEENIGANDSWEPASPCLTLRRMMPDSLPELDFREAENEITQLLNKNGMAVPKGHLDQAISAFSRGEWASANAQLRTFFESYLDEIAVGLGCAKTMGSKAKRDYLGKLDPPFLAEGLNEWNANNQKLQYIQGLMSRMHPEGSHAGLSEEDDAAFRLQITLITARLLLRRFNKRKSQI